MKAVRITRRSRFAGTLIAAFLAFGLFAGAADAGWNPSTPIAPSGPSATGTVAAGLPDGTGVVAWTQTSGGQPAVYGSRVDADGNAGAPVLLSTSGQAAETPDLTIAPNGNATVAWVNTSGTNDVIQTNTFSAAGAAGTTVTRSAAGPAGQDAEAPDIVSNKDGVVAMSWRRFNGTNWIMQTLVQPASGAPSAVSDFLPFSIDSGLPDVAPKPDGTFVVAWAVGSGAVANIMFVPLAVDGTPGTAQFISYTMQTVDGTSTKVAKNILFNPDDVGVAISNTGRITIAWRQLADRADHTVVPDPPANYVWSAMFTTITVIGTSASPTYQIGPTPTSGSSPTFVSPVTDSVSQLAFARPPALDSVQEYRNLGALAWTNDVIGNRFIRSAAIGQSGSNTANVLYVSASPPLSTGDLGLVTGNPQIAVGADGTRVVSWNKDSAVPGVPIVQATRISPEGLPLDATTLATDSPQSADQTAPYIGSNGVSTVAFHEKDSGGNDITAISRYTDPQIVVNPSALKFGNALLNLDSTRSAYMTNPGTTSNKITSISVTGPDAGQFDTSHSNCVKDLGPNATCPITVTFRPTSAGDKSAVIHIASTGGNEVINVTGTGVARTRVSLKVKPAKQALKKGVAVNTPVTLKNTGGIAANNLKVCASGSKKVVRPKSKCKTLGSLGVGASKNLPFKIRLNGNAKKGKKYPVRYKVTIGDANSQIKYVKFALKGKKKRK